MWCALAAAAGAACEERKQPEGGDPPSRVNASKTAARRGGGTESFCDALFPAGKGPALQWPEMSGGAASPSAMGRRWVNVWATWCKPCLEELPRLRAWHDRLTTAGKRFELTFVSIDDSDATIAEFRQLHPEAPPSMRVADPTKNGAWFTQLGLMDNPPIPLHIFTDPAGRIRCARAGAVQEQDYDAIEKLLGE